MATYTETTLVARFSDDSTFTTSRDFRPSAYNPGSGTWRYEIRDVLALTAGTTIELGMYTDIRNIIIKNKDASNYVQATFRTTGGGSNNQVLRVLAGNIIALGGAITLANDLILTANTADVACDVCVIGT